MTSRTVTRRHTKRYPIPQAGQATVELTGPGNGAGPLLLPLVDVSGAGVSFAYGPNELQAIDCGTNLGRAVIRIGSCEMRGELVVMHVTPGTGSQTVCGALFYPESDADLLKLKSVIAGMEAFGRP